MNTIVYTNWTAQICIDASEIGIGGYNTDTGLAWRWKLPDWLYQKFHINALEFLAAFVGIGIELIEAKHPHPRTLCLTDNSSALGWLYKSNFNPSSQIEHDHIARSMANKLLEHEAALYSQHIAGKSNVIADSLSRDHHIQTKHLTFLSQSLFHDQKKGPLRILTELPPEIISFLSSLRHLPTKTSASQTPPAPSSLGLLFDGQTSLADVV